MELLERYLQAVRFWLPKEQKQDIIAELSEDLRSQIEEKETELGRKLSEAEVEAILKQRGRPVLVANRYLPQQYLIGPLLFPIYSFVLKIVALFYLLPWVLVWIALLAFSPTYRAQHTNLFTTALSAWSSWWVTALTVLATVTIVFVVLEQVQAKSGFLEKWDPRKLPPVRNPNRIQRSASILELAANMAFCLWWVTSMSSPTVVNRSEVKVSFLPAWRYFFWGFFVLALFNIALSAVNLARPYWTTRRATFRLGCDCIGSALFCWLLKAGILVEIVVPNVSPERAMQITNAINLWAGRAVPAAILVGVVIAWVDIYRIYRVKTRLPPFSQGVTAAAV